MASRPWVCKPLAALVKVDSPRGLAGCHSGYRCQEYHPWRRRSSSLSERVTQVRTLHFRAERPWDHPGSTTMWNDALLYEKRERCQEFHKRPLSSAKVWGTRVLNSFANSSIS